MSTLYIAASNRLLEQNNYPREYLDTLLRTLKLALATEAGDQVIELRDFNYFGALLKKLVQESDYDSVLIFPIDLINYEVLEQLVQQAGAAAIAAKIIPPNEQFDYEHIDTELMYIDFQKLKSLNYVDFGTALVFRDELHLHQPQLSGSTYSYSTTNKRSSVKFGTGWILISQILGSKFSIETVSSLTATTLRYNDHLLSAVSLDSEYEFDQNQLAWIQLAKSAMAAQWQADLANSLTFVAAPDSVFVTDQHSVENFYTVVDFDFESLKHLYLLSRNDRTRIVFLSDSVATQDILQHVLSNWTGSNTADIVSDSAVVDKLGSFYSSFAAGEFEQYWAYINSIYHAFYIVTSIEFVDDIESQRYVNNVVWAGNSQVASLTGLANKQLEATEVVYKINNQYAVRKIGLRVFERDQYQQLWLTFRNTQTNQQLRVRYKIEDHLLGQKWARCCHYDYLLAEKSIVEKNYMLQHWQYAPGNPNARDIPALCSEMNRYVNVINLYFDGSAEDRVPYHITQYFDPATLNQQILNEIHHHFELLIGQVWSVSEYYKMANWATKFSIRQLNNLCHEMESLCRPTIGDSKNSTWAAGIYFPWIPTSRYKFVESDYDHFTMIQEFGNLCLHYAQLGKTPLEAYAGRDDDVFDENITGLRYLSGEFDIMFMPDWPAEAQRKNQAKHNAAAFDWIRARGQDPESKFTGIGFIPVARIIRSDFPGMTAEQVMLKLFEFDDIVKLELVDGNDNVTVARTLDYTWRDVLDQTDPTRNGNFGSMF